MIVGNIVDKVYTSHKDKIELLDPEELSGFFASIMVVVRDKNGKIKKVYSQRSHSPTKNFIGLLLGYTWYKSTGNSFTLTNATGGTYNYQPCEANIGIKECFSIAYPNNQSPFYGYISDIVVGSGSLSDPYTAYKLDAPISNGSGTGQLVYGNVSVPTSITTSGSSAYFIISQSYTNNSGGTITISEVGIKVYGSFSTYAGNYKGAIYMTLLIWYDVLLSPITVDNGDTITINYKFTVNP